MCALRTGAIVFLSRPQRYLPSPIVDSMVAGTCEPAALITTVRRWRPVP